MKQLITGLFLLTTSIVWAGTSNLLLQDTSKPFVLGKIENLHSEILGEDRTINVYLPEGYDPKDTIRYPVIFLLDGGASEDFIHIAGLVQFCSFPWVDQLPRSILIGIANVDRRRDYTFPTNDQKIKAANPTAGHSKKFIDFLRSELIPYVERKYKINRSRTLIGESLGGLLATEILLNHTNLFNKYIIVSPSLWWDNGSILNMHASIFTPSFDLRTHIYIGVGKEGLTPTTPPRVMEVDANMLADKLVATGNKRLDIIFDYLPAENHGTIMHQAVLNAFRLLYKK